MKKRLLFGVWEPDAVEMTGGDKAGLTQCQNVIPTTRGYKAIPAWDGISVNGVGVSWVISTFTSICGALSTYDNNGKTVDFISDTSAIYMASEATNSLTAVTGSAGSLGPSTAAAFRDLTQYGNYVIATSGAGSTAADPSYFEHGSSTVFATLTTALKAKTVATVRDFVVFGHTRDSADGERVTRVRWSAFGDPFTYTPSAATQSDLQDLKSDIGIINKIIGGDIGYVVGTNGTYLMEYVGPPTIFRFSYIHPGIGTYHPQSCVLYNGRLYMWSSAGFVSLGPSKGDIRYIGAGRVDSSFQGALGTPVIAPNIIGYADPANYGIGWQYERSTTYSGSAYFYHVPSDSWVQHTGRPFAWFVYSSSMSQALGGYGKNKLTTALAFGASATNGAPFAQIRVSTPSQVTLGSGFEELEPGRRAFVERVYLIADRDSTGGVPVLNVTSIPHTMIGLEDTASYESAGTWNTTEKFWTGNNGAGFQDGRYHKFEMQNGATSPVTGGEQQFYALDVVYHPRGEY